MAEHAPSWRRSLPRSVRVRVTAASVLLVVGAVVVAAAGLLWSVEHQLVEGVRARNTEQAAMIAGRLALGVAPADAVAGSSGGSATFIEVRDEQGNPIVPADPRIYDELALRLADPVLPTDSPVASQVSLGRPGDGDGVMSYEVAARGVSVPSGKPLTVLAASPLDGVRDSIATLKGALIAGLPFFVVLVGCIAWYVTGRALRPVEAIRVEVEAISGGTLHRRVPEPPTGDEVGRLARTMNAMLDRLESSAVRQRQFASDASHELRSPVAAIRTEVEVALRDPEVDWPAVADRVLREEDRLEALVADLLLLASVDEQTRARRTGSVDLGRLATQDGARRRLVPVAVSVEDGPGARPPVVDGRGDHLRRVVANLVDNAARHARSAVAVTVSSIGDEVRLVVDDDGPGIPGADRQRVFERFARLDPARARGGAGGAGLGLALVRAVVDAHHGSVTIEDAPGLGGARFIVVLPASRTGTGGPGHRRSGLVHPGQ